MGERWQQWARHVLVRMDARPDDFPVGDMGSDGARAALRHHAEHGGEPYVTLKGFVCLNGLESDQ